MYGVYFEEEKKEGTEPRFLTRQTKGIISLGLLCLSLPGSGVDVMIGVVAGVRERISA
jgi:hypothetical protein